MESRYATCGFFTTRNSYVISNDKAYTNRIFERLWNDGKYQFKFGEFQIASIRDLTVGYDSKRGFDGFKPSLPVDPSSHMITYEFVNGACLTLRTSGTEPKIKYYLEVTHAEKEECESRRGRALRGRTGRSDGEGDRERSVWRAVACLLQTIKV